MLDDIRNILIDRDGIQEAVVKMGKEITRDYRGKDLHIVGVLRGSAPFTSDLIMEISLPLTFDFISITSYSNSAQSTGVVRITKDLDEDISGKHLLVSEGIVDTGLTLSYILRSLELRKPASLKVCTLLDKKARRIIDVPIAYRGYEIADEFVVGYGLDWRQKYRNLPFIAVLKAHILEGEKGGEESP